MKNHDSKIDEKTKKQWKLFLILISIVVLIFVFNLDFSVKEEKKNKPEYLEIDVDELYATFSDLSPYSELQKEDLYNEQYKGKLIKTSIRALA